MRRRPPRSKRPATLFPCTTLFRSIGAMDKADLAGGVAIALFGILMIFVVIPLDTEEGMYYGLPPTFFPTLLCIGVTGCAAALAGRAWLRLRAGEIGSAHV